MSDAKHEKESCCGGLAEVLEPRFFKALCEPSRVAVLARLAEFAEPATVTQVAACCPQNMSVISRHLAALREVGIVSAEKRGKEVFYALRYRELAATLREVADAIERCCEDAAGTTCGTSSEPTVVEIKSE